MCDHLRLFGLLMHVGANGKRSKTEAMFCPAKTDTYSAGDTSDLLLDCGGTVSFTESFVYLGSLLHYDLSDHHDVEARLKKASQAFCALRSNIFSSRDIPERLKGQGVRWRRPGGFAVRLRVVVPHGRVGATAG